MSSPFRLEKNDSFSFSTRQARTGAQRRLEIEQTFPLDAGILYLCCTSIMIGRRGCFVWVSFCISKGVPKLSCCSLLMDFGKHCCPPCTHVERRMAIAYPPEQEAYSLHSIACGPMSSLLFCLPTNCVPSTMKGRFRHSRDGLGRRGIEYQREAMHFCNLNEASSRCRKSCWLICRMGLWTSRITKRAPIVQLLCLHMLIVRN